MGTSYFTAVVYGVRETKDMRKARNTTIQVEVPVCANNPKHRWSRWERHPPKFCPDCGGEVARQEVDEPYVERAAVAYAAEGLDPENSDRDYDIMINDWVHDCAPNSSDGDVVLGVCLTHKRRDEVGVYDLPVPTAEQIEQVRAYIQHLGLKGLPIKIHLIIGAM
jgi:hypothetical protein